ncbi:alpha/beta fold hydrolase [Gephyromycinifex aptenodytis]|uniref:alpha/beta fold hydrolase n=1 Tax=Gephyromycinifex aptenodytis TaxID=2716227 RepID=UPI0029C9E6FC|nr:alpha/beta fold hydrolase [Gephyromycinifex aptenodytis]
MVNSQNSVAAEAPQLGRLPGMDPAWSQFVAAPDAEGITRRWHVLMTGTGEAGTLLAVHGNPTWSYLWRGLLAAAPAGWRVIAVDQLGMGYSEHPGGDLAHPRRLLQRIGDLSGLTDALGITGEHREPGNRAPVIVAGHDWGGLVATGWAGRHRDVLSGIVLANTAVHHDFDSGLPAPLTFAHSQRLLRRVCVDTPLFVAGATAISSPRPSAQIRQAYAAPYRSAAQREFVGQFVADIPAAPSHPTRAGFAEVAEAASRLGAAGVPALLLRGAKDPVFSEAHLRDLIARMPQADVHRYEGASHLVLEDAPRSATDIWTWVGARIEGRRDTDPAGDPQRLPQSDGAIGTAQEPWLLLRRRAEQTPQDICVAEVRSGRRVTFAQFEQDVLAVAHGLREAGVAAGDRVALLVPPGIDLTVVVYACWRLGAVIVVADAGLGLASMGRALRGAGPAHVVTIPKGLAAVMAMRVPGQRIVVGQVPAGVRRAAGVSTDLEQIRSRGRALAACEPDLVPQPPLSDNPDAAVLFTSGATGPSKGVVYRLEQLRAQIGHVGQVFGLVDAPRDRRLVAAFAPFALYGPALGVGAVVPDMDVTAPGSLSAAALAEAVRTLQASTVFASPAALRNVLRTSTDLSAADQEALNGVRLLTSAGAPVPSDLLRELRAVFPNASMHTPYGMTECLPVADITLEEIDELEARGLTGQMGGTAGGVAVGHPLPGVQVMIAPLPKNPDEADGELTSRPGVTGEICVRATHVKDRYDRLWATEQASAAHPPGWHRTGDVGHLDEQGRLWVEGRRVHVVHTAEGPVTPVALEQRCERLPEVASAAVVGVGPIGAQQVVVVLTLEQAGSRPPVLAPPSVAEEVRRLAGEMGQAVAAVLVAARMPVDIRHQSKIDRSLLARWAQDVLAGRKPPSW